MDTRSVMDTRQIPRPRPETIGIQQEIDQYRVIVNDVFAHHTRICQEDCVRCSCGESSPCPAEQLAALLLDWV
jgi:hypothetical protein